MENRAFLMFCNLCIQLHQMFAVVMRKNVEAFGAVDDINENVLWTDEEE